MKKPFYWILIFLGLIALFPLRQYTDVVQFNEVSKDFGAWALLPSLVALILCFATKEVIPSLFVGIFLGGIVSGKFNIVQEYLIPSIGSAKYGEILLVYLWCLGGLIGIWTRTGGAQHFATWAGRRIARSRRSAKFFAFLMGVLFHQGGTISTSPVATLLPFNVWPIYIGSLVLGTSPIFADAAISKSYLFKAIPVNFYCWVAILFTFLLSWEKLPYYGKRMQLAMQRVKATNKLDRDGSNPLVSKELTTLAMPKNYQSGLEDFVFPIGVLLIVAIGPYVLTGKLRVSEAFVMSVLAAMGLALYKGMDLKTVIEGFVEGCKGVTVGAIILGLAVTLGSVSQSLGTANYVVRTTSTIIVPFLLPAIYLFLTMFISFSIGTSWGTYAVVFPIAMPLAYSINPDPFYNLLCFAAVTGGSVYGDNCSPISDTTILSSLATGTDLMDHVLTQFPLATTAALISGLMYIIVALLVV